MRLLAALAVGWACAALAALLAGVALPAPRWPATDRRRSSRQRIWLQQAGLSATPPQFGAATLALAATTFALIAVATGPIVAVVPALAIGFVPFGFYSHRRTQRLAVVQAAWPDGLRDLLASISSGHSLQQALLALAGHGPEPLRAVFARFPTLSRAVGTVPALESIREELSDPVSDRVIEVLILAYERGGGIVRVVLADLTAAITADLKVNDELHTAILESRINARAVVALPWLVLVFLNIGDGPFRAFYSSGAGLVTVAIGTVLSIIGIAWISRLGRLPAEQRVFGTRVAA